VSDQPNLTIVIASFLVVTFLSINAFFLKDILRNLTDLKLLFTRLNTEHTMYAEQVVKHDKEIDKMRDRLHSLEGSTGQVLQFLKDYENKQFS